MRENIDLTKDRTFRDKEIPRRTFTDQDLINFDMMVESLRKAVYGTFPWGPEKFGRIESENDLKSESIIITGSREEREHAKRLQMAVGGRHCERCGQPLDKFPWKKTNLLICHECNEILEAEFNNRFPWEVET